MDQQPSIVKPRPTAASPLPAPDLINAWQALSRLGLPGRHGGRTPGGQVEFLIIDPRTGATLTSGTGGCLAEAICTAVLRAESRRLPGTGGCPPALTPQT